MAQVLTTIFFSAAFLASAGLIAAMLGEEFGTIRRALGLDRAPRALSGRVRVRRVVRTQGFMPRRPLGSPLRAAA